MMRVKDESGRIIEGVCKDSNGAIIIQPDSNLTRYRQQQEVINRLTDKIDSVSSTVDQLRELILTLTKEKNRL